MTDPRPAEGPDREALARVRAVVKAALRQHPDDITAREVLAALSRDAEGEA